MNKLLCLICLLLLSACAGKPVIIERIPFNPGEYADRPSSGTAVVIGQAFIKAADGKVYYPKNEQARLNPVTSYSKQWYEVNYLARQNIADADPRYLSYVYKADFDQEGRFKFQNLPAGDYYISAPIFWMEETKLADGSILMKRQGRFICKEIHIDEGQTLVANISAEQPLNLAASN